MAPTPPIPSDDPFEEADGAPGDIADVTSRILAKHAVRKAERGGTARSERPPTGATAAPTGVVAPRPDLVIGIILANHWIEPERVEELREYFRVKGVTQVLAKRGRIAGILVERGLLKPAIGRELELTLMDQGTFPRYRITRLLGQGLVGRTYEALDIQSGGDVAFKVFRQSEPQKIQLFLQDFAALQNLRHPRIAQALACGVSGDMCFTASTLIAGERLSRLMAARRISSEVLALRIARQLTEGLAAIHAETGLCHLTLRPQNVLVRGQGAHRSIVLTDVAVADQIPAYRSVDSTWQAPEIASGGPGDLRSDIFSVGTILYHMLAEMTAGDGNAEAVGDLRRFHARTREVIDVSIDRDPQGRYADYPSLIASLSDALQALGHSDEDERLHDAAAADSSPPLTARTGRRKKVSEDDWSG